jgi:hypothetical protein
MLDEAVRKLRRPLAAGDHRRHARLGGGIALDDAYCFWSKIF